MKGINGLNMFFFVLVANAYTHKQTTQRDTHIIGETDSIKLNTITTNIEANRINCKILRWLVVFVSVCVCAHVDRTRCPTDIS